MSVKGYVVVATTTFSDGVSYDAHNLAHTKMVRGPKMPTAALAMKALNDKCRKV